MAETYKNPKVAALFARALAQANISQADLVRSVPFGRGPIGAVIRGETKRVDPEVANIVCRRLGIRIELYLEASGYDLTVLPEHRLPTKLLEAWPNLLPDVQRGLLALIPPAAIAESREGSSGA